MSLSGSRDGTLRPLPWHEQSCLLVISLAGTSNLWVAFVDPTICKLRRNFVFGCFSFFFSKQNQVPQILIGMGRVVYDIKAFLSRDP